MFNASGFDLGTAHGRIVIDGSGIASGIQSAQKQYDNALASIGASMTKVGKTLTTNITLPLVGAGIVAGKMAIDFESAFAGVRKTVDATEEEFAALKASILDMATSPDRLTSSLENADVALARIMELAGQLGVRGTENLSKFTETVALLQVTTNIMGEEGALALAQFANITQMPIDQIDRLGSVIVDLGNNMATTEADILEMAMRIAGAGNVAGLTQQQIFALGAALSSAGIRAEAGGTAISRVLIDINAAVDKGGEKMAAFAKVAGLSASEFAQAWETDAAAALNLFILGLGRVEEEGGNVTSVLEGLGFSEIRVRDALLRLATGNDLLSQSLGIANEAWEENTALTDEAAKRAETTESALNRLKNNLRNAARAIGEAMTPALANFSDRMVPVVQGITKWIENNPAMVGQLLRFAGALAAIGPVLFVVGKGIGIITTAFKVLGPILGLITSPLGLVATAIVGVVAALDALGVIDVEHIFNTVRGVFQSFINDISEGGSIQGAVLAALVNLFGEETGSKLGIVFNNLFGPAIQWIQKAIEAFGRFSGAIQAGVNPIEAGLTLIGDLFGTEFQGRVKGALDDVSAFINTHVLPRLNDLYTWFTVTALPAIADFVTNTALPAVQDFIDILEGIWTVVSIGLTALYDWFVTNGLPFIQEKIEYVKEAWQFLQDMLAGAWNMLQPLLQPIVNWFRDVFQYIGTNYIKPVTDFIQGVIDRAREALDLLRQIGGGEARTVGVTSPPQYNTQFGNNGGVQWHDNGGRVGPGDIALIGRGAQPEAFIPDRPGTMVPNFDKLMGNGVSIQNLTIQANGYTEGAAAAQGFEDRLRQLRRSQG